MHILFLTDNFPPEVNAPASRTYEHAKEWVKLGYKVTIITCAPNFPKGKVFDGYKNSFFKKSIIDGIEVWRVKTYITANKGIIKRTLDYISFMIMSFLFGLFVKKVDVVIGTSPQFFTVISACLLAKIKKCMFVFELRDIWPASITSVGAINDGPIIRFFEFLEILLYKKSNLIISVTESFKDELIKKGIDGNKIKIILNGSDLTKFRFTENKNCFFMEKFFVRDKFVVSYIGTHGLAHSLETIIGAAKILKNENLIKFIFVGEGAEKERIRKLVQEYQLSNVVMGDGVSKDQMPDLLSICDVSLVTLKNKELFRSVIPSKIFESMAIGIPIIIAVPEGEATKIILENNCGLQCNPESPDELAEMILYLAYNKEKLSMLKKSCLATANKFDRKVQAKKMINEIEIYYSQYLTKRKSSHYF